ncbi:MAG: hypothetical protein ACKO3N_08330 [Verrucomicrobiota bacterium]
MTETEKMLEEINSILRLVGQLPIEVPGPVTAASELDFLARVKAEYTRRLVEGVPKYQSMDPEAIPEMFLQALKSRKAQLESGGRK